MKKSEATKDIIDQNDFTDVYLLLPVSYLPLRMSLRPRWLTLRHGAIKLLKVA